MGRGGPRPGSGRKKGSIDPRKRDAIELLKGAAPAIVEKALSMIMCDEPNVQVMTALIKKIFPDNLNLSGGENPLMILLERYHDTETKI
jgi:hypothetical protein